MYQNLMSTIKKKNLLKYLIIGLLNTFFSYFIGIFFYTFIMKISVLYLYLQQPQ